jgi:hypothetical protein
MDASHCIAVHGCCSGVALASPGALTLSFLENRLFSNRPKFCVYNLSLVPR